MADLDRLITLVIRGPSVRDNFNVLQPGAEVFRGRVWAELRAADRELDFGTGNYQIGGRQDVPHTLAGGRSCSLPAPFGRGR